MRSRGHTVGPLPILVPATAVLDERDLSVGDSSRRFSNAGAVGLVALNLPAPGALGVYYQGVSLSHVGLRFRCPTHGVYISHNGQLGTRFTAMHAGATCTIEATSSAIWTVTDTSGDWELSGPEEDEFSDEALAWRDEVESNGGSASIDAMIVRDAFIFKEKASGAWDLTEDYLILMAENEAQALTSLKRRFLCIANGSPLFAANVCYSFDGYAQYVDWPFVPATHGVVMTTTNKRLGVYCLSNQSSTGAAIGTYTADGNAMSISPRRSDGRLGGAVNGSAFFPLVVDEAAGFSVLSRSDTTTLRGYKNGVRLTDQASASTPSLSSHSFFIGARNFAGGGVDRELNCSIAFAVIGAQLSDAQEAAQYANVQEMAIHYGVPV